MPVVALLPDAAATLTVHPWPDAVIDQVGHDPRSAYVERFWLGILGPSTTWLLRRIATGFDTEPEGFELPLADTAAALGIAGLGRNGPFARALARSCQFGLATPTDVGLAVRRRVPPLTRRQVERLPASLQEAHAAFQEAQLRHPSGRHERARRLALTLVELGEDVASAEAQLLAWRFAPDEARAALDWAVAAAAAAARDAGAAA